MARLEPHTGGCALSAPCLARNATLIEQLRGGMGSLFATVATMGES